MTPFRGLTDPVERRWRLGRLRNRWPAASAADRSGLLDARPVAEIPNLSAFADLTATAGSASIGLPDGQSLAVGTETADDIVDQAFADPASAAAFHAFAWLPDDEQGTALAVLWPAWLRRFGIVDRRAMAWQPLVTAERLVALIDFFREKGVPAPRDETAKVLAAHAATLLHSLADPAQLALDGSAVLGWALARLGLDCAMPVIANWALDLILAEGERLVRPSGMSAVESTHRHLALARCYADAWLAASRHGRREATVLQALARRLIGVVPLLVLPGGMPLIGDIAETLPPGWLTGLASGAPLERGWTGRLPTAERQAFATLRDEAMQDDLEALRRDGWLRVDYAGWSGLWHSPVTGWPLENGAGHHDLGACELHYRGVPIFLDPGGSPLGEINGAGYCALASAHGGLQLNDSELYPTDRSAYSDEFRRDFAGPPPVLAAEFDGASLAFIGATKQSGLRQGGRRWRFSENGFVLEDMLNGTGRSLVSRRFITPLAVEVEDDGTVLLTGNGQRFRLIADGPVVIGEGHRWTGYGQSETVHFIEVSSRANLPWRGTIRVEAAPEAQ